MNLPTLSATISILLLVYLPNRFNVGQRFESFGWGWHPTDLAIPILLLGAFFLQPRGGSSQGVRRSPALAGWIFGWGATAVISTLLASSPEAPTSQGLMALAANLLWVLPLFLVPALALSKGDIRTVLYSFLILAAIGGGLAVSQALAAEQFSSLLGWRFVHYVTDSERRAVLPLGPPTVIGAFFGLALPIGFALMVRPGWATPRILGAAGVFLAGMGCLFTSSRAALLLLMVVGGLSALWLVWPRGSRLLPTLALLGLAVGIGVAVSQLNFQRLTEVTGGYGSGEWRMRGIETAAAMIREKPILGHGTESHFKRQKAPVRGFFSTTKAHDAIYHEGRISPSEPHNLYLMIASEWGLMGLSFYLGMLFQIALWLFRAQASAIDPMDRLILRGFLIGFAGMLFHSLFGSDLVRQTRMAPLFFLYCGLGIRYGSQVMGERLAGRNGSSAAGDQPPLR